MTTKRISLYGKSYMLNLSDYSVVEIVGDSRIPVSNESLINAIVCEFWEPKGRYSGT